MKGYYHTIFMQDVIRSGNKSNFKFIQRKLFSGEIIMDAGIEVDAYHDVLYVWKVKSIKQKITNHD